MLESLGFALLALRGHIPDFFSIVVANTLFAITLVLLYAGLKEIKQEAYRIDGMIMAPVLLAVSFSYYLWAENDIHMRFIIGSAVIAFMLLVLCKNLFIGIERSKRLPYWMTGGIMLCGAIAHLSRLVLLLSGGDSLKTVFSPSIYQDVTFLGAFFATTLGMLYFMLIVSDTLNEELRKLAAYDPLTGAYNRRSFEQLVAREFSRSQRQEGRHASLLLIDLDHFKLINDRYGHPTGDIVLKETAAVIRGALRQQDIFSRLGGEEFCVLLPETGAQEAHGIAERLRFIVACHRSTHEIAAMTVTCSIGVATQAAPAQTLEALMAEADAAMYQAKRQGRNQVVMTTSGLAPEPT